jgi:phage terminase large subunit
MPKIKVASKLVPLIVKEKRLKVALGGRGGSKSIGVADSFLKFCADGERLCCAREMQNSIEESVHALLKERIEALELEGELPVGEVWFTKDRIYSRRGGEIFYKGLSRNLGSLKSMQGVKRIWVEEAQYLSQETLEILMPTIRASGSELWFTLNRGSSQDPISLELLAPYEDRLAANDGYYEDDEIILVEINYRDNPWFPPELEQQRLRDLRTKSTARYDHIWNGRYSDSIENAIIEPEWFDACVNAHKKLGFEAVGRETVIHDPSDGVDPSAECHRHGNVIVELREHIETQVNDAAKLATDFVLEIRADMFVWDGDGMGAALRKQVSDALRGKQCQLYMFKGSHTVLNPHKVYQPIDGERNRANTNAQTFSNQRAQWYWSLRDRMFRTYMAIQHGVYSNPDDLISFNGDMPLIGKLRAELCRIPRKPAGRIQILSKQEMRKLKIKSPNLADVVMMSEVAELVDNGQQLTGVNAKHQIAKSGGGWT